MEDARLLEIQKKAIEVIDTIRVLEEISWPQSVEKDFFRLLENRQKTLPTVNFQVKDVSDKKQALKKLLPLLSKEIPMHVYTSQTISSYLNALDMISSAGTQSFQHLSVEEYGRPDHLLFGSEYSHLETARQFLDSFSDYDHPYITNKDEPVSPRELKDFLIRESAKALLEDAPKVTIAKGLVAKAAASRNKVRIREDATFNRVECKNLLVHEVFTHTLTAINGNLQAQMPLLGWGAPRTTKTQEGLATFSEVVTGLMSLNRLKRLCLRVLAIDKALSGADLLDLYNFFRENGEGEKESFLAASRVFRGGYPKGGIVFTKDGVYLEGLIRVHSFFRWAFKTSHEDLVHLLFIGRLDINDVFLLKDSYTKGYISPPAHLPDWYLNTNLLAGKMAFSLILNKISLDYVEEHYQKKLLQHVAA